MPARSGKGAWRCCGGSPDRSSPPGWRPLFVDYLYLGLTNATAFSPTDVMPLRHWAKLTMGVQSLISLIILGLANTLPHALYAGLVAQGVPSAAAHQAAARVFTPDQLAYRSAVALAAGLGIEPVPFPGAHGGFASYPEPFAAQLHEVLSNS